MKTHAFNVLDERLSKLLVDISDVKVKNKKEETKTKLANFFHSGQKTVISDDTDDNKAVNSQGKDVLKQVYDQCYAIHVGFDPETMREKTLLKAMMDKNNKLIFITSANVDRGKHHLEKHIEHLKRAGFTGGSDQVLQNIDVWIRKLPHIMCRMHNLGVDFEFIVPLNTDISTDISEDSDTFFLAFSIIRPAITRNRAIVTYFPGKSSSLAAQDKQVKENPGACRGGFLNELTGDDKDLFEQRCMELYKRQNQNMSTKSFSELKEMFFSPKTKWKDFRDEMLPLVEEINPFLDCLRLSNAYVITGREMNAHEDPLVKHSFLKEWSAHFPDLKIFNAPAILVHLCGLNLLQETIVD